MKILREKKVGKSPPTDFDFTYILKLAFQHLLEVVFGVQYT